MSFPSSLWRGASETRGTTPVETTGPDAFDWQRMLSELLEIQKAAAGLLYANTAASSEVENTVVATAFDVSYTMPANTIVAGDRLKIRARGIVVDNNSTDTLALALKIGSTTIASIGAEDVADNDEFLIEAEIFAVSTAAALVTKLVSDLAAPASWTLTRTGTAEVALDFTSALAITVVATWSVAHADNEVKLTQLTVERQRYLAA